MRKLVLAAIAGTVVLLLASCGNKTTQDKVNHKVENAKESVDHAMDKAADKIDKGADKVKDAWNDTKKA